MEKQQKVSSSFKISFGQEIRRISVSSPPPTFSQFLENVSQIFGTRFHTELTVQYVDEDNDRITVSSELEWNEALRYLEPFSVKKLFLSEGNGVFFKDSPPPVPLFFYKESSKPTTESSNCNNNNNNQSKKEAPKKGTCHRFGRAGPHFMHRKFGGGAKHQRHQTHLDALKDAIPRCLGIFFPDGKILPHHFPEFLKEAVQVKLIPNSENDVDLDVNIPLLRQVLFRRGLSMLDSHKYEEGRVAFLALVELSANDPLAHYNLACAEALLGNHDEAVSMLSRSVECGYRSLPHLLADPDLDSLRNHSGYLKVVDSLKAMHSISVSQKENNNGKKDEKKEVKEVKEEVVPLTDLKMVEKKVEQPQQPQQPEKENEKDQEKKEESKKEIHEVEEKKKEPQMSEEVAKYATELQLLADMGFSDRQKNLVLLVANNGDLPNVIHHLF